MLEAAVLSLALFGTAWLTVRTCHAVVQWLACPGSSEEANRGKLQTWIVLGVWSIAMFCMLGERIRSGSAQGAYHKAFNQLAQQAHLRAEEIAHSRGEVATGGPIYHAEYGPRYLQAQQQVKTPTAFNPYMEQVILGCWIACGLMVGAYYFVALQRRLGRLGALACALALTISQCFVIGITTIVLSLVAHVVMGGTL